MQRTVSKILLFKNRLMGRVSEGTVSLLRETKILSAKPLPLVNGLVCHFPEETLKELSGFEREFVVVDNPVLRITPEYVSLDLNKDFKHKGESIQIIPYGVSRIGANRVWSVSRGREVKIGVLDTGADYEHPDLKGNLKRGFNFTDYSLPPSDDNGHGSHIAGTIAACDNGMGVIGVAPDAHIYPLKVLNRWGEGLLSNVIEALEWCVRNGIRVVNMSFGTDKPNLALERGITAALNEGVVIVSAAGNRRYGGVEYPAAYKGTIAVGSVDNNDRVSWFSSTGHEVDAVAPGEMVLSTSNNGSYKRISGTSMSSAHVTGAVALLLSKKPYLTPYEVIKFIKGSCEPLPGVAKNQQGAGLVRIDKILL